MTVKNEAKLLIKYFKKRKITPGEAVPIMLMITEAYQRVLLVEMEK